MSLTIFWSFVAAFFAILGIMAVLTEQSDNMSDTAEKAIGFITILSIGLVILISSLVVFGTNEYVINNFDYIKTDDSVVVTYIDPTTDQRTSVVWANIEKFNNIDKTEKIVLYKKYNGWNYTLPSYNESYKLIYDNDK